MRVDLRWPDELVERIDAARGDVPRSRFIARAVEQALEPETDWQQYAKDVLAAQSEDPAERQRGEEAMAERMRFSLAPRP